MRLKSELVKKVATLGIIGTMSVAGMSTSAMAASSVSGKLNGFTYTASISKDNYSATAKTTFARGGSNIKATATVYYWFDEVAFQSTISANSSAGGVSAVAQKKKGGADVVGGKGEHSVSYDAYSWGPVTTTTGTIIPTAKKL